MRCMNAGLVGGLVCILVSMEGLLGQPVDQVAEWASVAAPVLGKASTVAPGTNGTATSTPDTVQPSTGASTGERTTTIPPKMQGPLPATSNMMHASMEQHVRYSKSLSKGEQEYVLERKQSILESLWRLRINTTLDSVPHVALLGSGGGQRAAVSLLGSLHQMEQDGLLDTLLYLGGVSGSAWTMASLYRDPDWSSNMDRGLSVLSDSGPSVEEALAWLRQRSKVKHFSLTDIWGVMTSATIMNQLDLNKLSEQSGRNTTNPYPVYNAIDKHCHQRGNLRAEWFEVTPHESGFTDLGLFVNSSQLGSRNHEEEMGVVEPQLEMDMAQLHGIVGSSIAEEMTLTEDLPDWLKGLVGAAFTDNNNLVDLWIDAPKEIKSVWDRLDIYMSVSHTLLKVVELMSQNEDNTTAPDELEILRQTLEKILEVDPFTSSEKKDPEKRKKNLSDQWSQEILKPLEAWSKTLEKGPHQEYISWLIEKVFPLIGRWEWGTMENFLYQSQRSRVPHCLRSKEHIHLIDAGSSLTLPFPPFLGAKRDVDLIIALDYSLGQAFETLTRAKDYAARLRKPFPNIDDKILEERDWPKDFYVFQGEQSQPTIIYMPLFNRNNSKDAAEIQAKLVEYATFQPPYSQEKIEALREIAEANMRRNKYKILREIREAAERRQNKM